MHLTTHLYSALTLALLRCIYGTHPVLPKLHPSLSATVKEERHGIPFARSHALLSIISFQNGGWTDKPTCVLTARINQNDETHYVTDVIAVVGTE